MGVAGQGVPYGAQSAFDAPHDLGDDKGDLRFHEFSEADLGYAASAFVSGGGMGP